MRAVVKLRQKVKHFILCHMFKKEESKANRSEDKIWFKQVHDVTYKLITRKKEVKNIPQIALF